MSAKDPNRSSYRCVLARCDDVRGDLRAAAAYVEELDSLVEVLPEKYPCPIFGFGESGALQTQIPKGDELRAEGTYSSCMNFRKSR